MLDPIRQFLEQPLLAYISTIDAAGYPHTVPVWFGVDGDDLILPTGATSIRLRHIRANPKGAVAIGGNASEGEGYLIKGELRIEDDDVALRHAVIRRYVPGDAAEAFIAQVDQMQYAQIRLIPTKVTKVQ